MASHTHTHSHTTISRLSGFVRDKPGEPVPEETFAHSHYRAHQSSLISFIHLTWSMASSLFNLRAWQSFSTISHQVFFGLHPGLEPSSSYSIFTPGNHCLHFAAHAHYPYHRNLFCCSTEIISSRE